MTVADRGPPSGRATDAAAAQLVARLRSRWRLLVAVPAGLAALVVGVGLLLPRQYTARAAFVADVPGRGDGTIAGVAARLGVTVAPGEALHSPQLYAELARSDRVLRAVVAAPLRGDGSATLSGTLTEYYDPSSGDSLRDRDLAVRRLREELAVEVSARTGIVRLSTRQASPVLAAAVVDAVVGEVSGVSVEVRRSHAGAERAFVEERLAVAQEELRAAEGQLGRFLEGNRQYQASPRLALEYDRLQRVVALRQSVVLTLATALEEARIEEVRGTPVITVVEPPEPPALPDPRMLLFKAVATFGLGLLLIGAALIYGPAVRGMLEHGTRGGDG